MKVCRLSDSNVKFLLNDDKYQRKYMSIYDIQQFPDLTFEDDRRFGRFSKPMTPYESEIEGVPNTTVDQHNDALPSWIKAAKRAGMPLSVLHVDHHADMSGRDIQTMGTAATASPNLEINTIEKYASLGLGVENWIVIAKHMGALHELIWYDPRNDYALWYPPESLGTVEQDGYISWKEEPKPIRIELSDIPNSLENPLLIDYDIDGLLCFDDPTDQRKALIERHARNVQSIFDKILEPPVASTIAQSLNPSEWTPREDAPQLLKTAKRQVENLIVRTKNLAKNR